MAKTKVFEVEFKSEGVYDFMDLTDEVKKFVEKSGVKNGIVNIQTFHTTTAILLNEKETGLLEDIKKSLDRLAPGDIYYQHDDFEVRTENICDDECRNGHSHCKAIRLPASHSLNVVGGELQLGTWQRLLFFELDRARTRKAQVLVLGDKKGR
ncbi:MAG: secondary thiamine-phosphate synthase enzyme YjbQ [Candidatus Moranbacteria bacterium]|nr:secondary thiamine-phosphate synthase enzyme YjbQ [Candidatus Moranbacteria bacterium]